MEQVGTVAAGVAVPGEVVPGGAGRRRSTLAPGGAAGDRTLAVVDPAAGKVLSAKRYADLFMASARLDGDRVVLTLPDGSEHAADDAGVHQALSDWLGLAVRLEPPPVDGVFPMEMYTGMSDEDSPVFDWPGPPGTWLDLADAHWLTTASLAAIADEHPDGEWDVRRFRPTALIEPVADGLRGGGAGRTIEVGTVGSEVLMATPRCSMPSRAQPGLRPRQGHRHDDPRRQRQQPGRLRQGDAERNRPGRR